MADNMNSQDPVQHGIDDNPSGDAEKGAALGGLGGAAVGAAAGAMAGPLGMVVGAVVGGLAGAGASGLAVGAVDQVDNDNTVSGVGDGASIKGGGHSDAVDTSGSGLPGPSLAESGLMGAHTTSAPIPGASTGGPSISGGNTMATDLTPGNDIPGVQTGGLTTAGADTRGLTEKLADTVTGDRTDDKTGGIVTGGAVSGTGAYGLYEGRNISRDEYERLGEADRVRVQLIEETLHVDKDMRQTGEVAVSKHVVSEQVQVPVTLQHEEVIVTRRAVDQAVDATTSGTVFQDETIKVPVHEEVAVVTKEARVAEEIEIEKRSVSQQQTVTDTVRHEELDVHGNPADRVHVEGEVRDTRNP